MDEFARFESLFLLSFPFLFAGMWCAVSLLLSRMGGWFRLAQEFPAHAQPSGRRFIMQGGMVGRVQYSGCLTIYSSPEGLYLSVLFPFRLAHPPIFIPWGAIQGARLRRFLWSESVVFNVGAPAIAKMQLSKKVFDAQEVAYGKR
jgi:hypothetical protein